MVFLDVNTFKSSMIVQIYTNALYQYNRQGWDKGSKNVLDLELTT